MATDSQVQENSLAPPQGLAGAPQLALPSPLEPLAGAFAHTRAQHDKLSEAVDQMDLMRREFGRLGKLGDTVAQEDVIKSAGRLVGAGFDPLELASVMVDMPKGGQSLADWIGKHAAMTAVNEAKLAQVYEASRRALGASALKLLAGHATMNAFALPGAPQPGEAAMMQRGAS